jgi:hypothetical protein
MSDMIARSGPFGILIVLLAILNLGLVTLALVQMLGTGNRINPSLRNRINQVLFWGAFGAVIGLLGQANGIYLALRVVANAPVVSPPILMEGFAVSFSTTIMGLGFLALSSLAWFGLRGMHNRQMEAAAAP